MNQLDKSQRTLAYKTAQVIKKEDMDKIAGGSVTGSTSLTTKQTVDTRGNWDVGVDARW